MPLLENRASKHLKLAPLKVRQHWVLVRALEGPQGAQGAQEVGQAEQGAEQGVGHGVGQEAEQKPLERLRKPQEAGQKPQEVRKPPLVLSF